MDTINNSVDPVKKNDERNEEKFDSQQPNLQVLEGGLVDGAVAAVDDGQGRNTKKPEVLLDWSFDVVLESHVKDVFYHQDVLPLFQRAFSDNCLPDGSYTCPQCGGPLTINHDQARCNGTCKPKPGKKLTLFSYFDLYILASGKGGEKPLKFYSALYQLAARRSWVISHSALKEDQDNLRRSVEYAFGYMKSGFLARAKSPCCERRMHLQRA